MSVPSAPVLALRPEAGVSSLTFYWAPPTSNGGSAITKYTLACDALAYSRDISANQDTFTVSSGLTAATDYTFTMTATNATGTGPAASYRTVQVGGVPFGPTVATASTLTSTIAYLTWNLSTVAASAAAPKWFVVTVQPSTPALSSYKRCAYVYERAKTFTLPSTNVYYQFLIQSVSDTGYCTPFAYTSSLGFAIVQTAFSPSSIAAPMRLWIDATNTNSYTTTDYFGLERRVSALYDVRTSTIAANVIFQMAVSTNATLQKTTFKTTAYDSGANDSYYKFSSTLYTGSTITGFWVGAYSNSGGNPRLITFEGPGGPDYSDPRTGSLAVGFTGNNNVSVYRNYPNVISATVLSPTKGTPFFLSASISPNSQYIGINGGAPSTSLGTNSTFNMSTIQFGGANFLGEIGEVLLYYDALTPFDRQKIEGYLGWKWGLQSNLPTSHPFKAAAPTATSVFSPSSLSGLIGWLDGGDPLGTGTKPSNGASITTWVDKSGQSNSGTAAGTAPTYSATSNAVNFSGQNGYYTTSISASSSNESAFIVGTATSIPASQQNILGSSGLGGRNVGIWWDRAGLYNGAVGVGTYTYTSNGSVSTNTTFIAENITNSLTMTSYVNGNNNLFNSSGALTAGNTTQIGGLFSGQVYNSIQYINEILIYNRSLSTDDRQTVEGYLAWKWGLQGNLPTTHPYKFLSPASNYSAAVVPQNLLVRFDATTYSGSGAWSNTAALGTNYNATVEIGTPSKNVANNGIVFNGSTSFTFSNIGPLTQYTASVWIKRTTSQFNMSTGNDGWIVIQKYNASSNVMNMGLSAGYGSSPSSITGTFRVTTGQNWYYGDGANTILNTWTHITATYDGSVLRAYQNGTLVTSSNINVALADNGLSYRIGRRFDDVYGSNCMVGEIGQMLIYNRALTAAEVAQNYAATSNTFSV